MEDKSSSSPSHHGTPSAIPRGSSIAFICLVAVMAATSFLTMNENIGDVDKRKNNVEQISVVEKSDKNTERLSIKEKVHSTTIAYNAYWCGWDDGLPSAFLKLVFNDAQNVDETTPSEDLLLTQKVLENHASNDVAFVSWQGPCIIDHRAPRDTQLPKQFKGSILYWSGESKPMYNLNVRDRVYALSHEPGDGGKQRMRVHYGVEIVATLPYEFQRTIFYPADRAQNTGERFLIYAAAHCVAFREQAFGALSQVGRGPAFFGAGCHGQRNDTVDTINYTAPVADNQLHGKKWTQNMLLFRSYRFALVMENTKQDGYLTEKIIMAWLSGTIPIYYGTTEVFDIFNKDAFIYYDVENPTPALERVAYMESNQTAYNIMLNQPILANGEKTIEEYFSFNQTIGKGKMRQRIRTMMGLPV